MDDAVYRLPIILGAYRKLEEAAKQAVVAHSRRNDMIGPVHRISLALAQVNAAHASDDSILTGTGRAPGVDLNLKAVQEAATAAQSQDECRFCVTICDKCPMFKTQDDCDVGPDGSLRVVDTRWHNCSNVECKVSSYKGTPECPECGARSQAQQASHRKDDK